MERKTKRDWLMQGLVILAEKGALALTTELLISRMGVTKGSFYHHFENFQDFKESMMALYDQEGTLEIIKIAEEAAKPTEKLQRILNATLEDTTTLEVAVRAWALQDPMVRAFQQRIDKQRIDYLQTLYLEMTGDPARAAVLAQFAYSLYIGSQHVIPPIQGEGLAALYREIDRILG
ncbi:MAG: TetR/AcrR family transcriptional regulator [Anaerolineae bacterium]|nr:TetR/AcrR family transcriptional regulator [Anaerolineae bacterium]